MPKSKSVFRRKRGLRSPRCDMHTTPLSQLQRLRQPSAQEAWARFVRLYTPLLYYWTRRTGMNETETADLVQEKAEIPFQGTLWFALPADGRTLAAGVGKEIKLWDVGGEQPRELGQIEAADFTMGNCSIVAAPNGKRLAWSSQNGSNGVVDLEGKQPKTIAKWRLPGGCPTLSFSADDQHMVMGNIDGTTYVVRLP